MCGIAGFAGYKDFITLQKMCNSLVHRGPDGVGYYEDEYASLGMRRLAIVDIERGKQPFFNEDETLVCVFNGEIYNHAILRKHLITLGHIFKSSHSDSEICVHAFEEWGENWVNKINGMFSVAIWDIKKHFLYLYRDRFGKKPLYYSVLSKKIIFASEIKAIFQDHQVPKTLNMDALGAYFAQKNIAAPATAYLNVNQLLPGHFLKWNDGNFSFSKYWQADFSPLTDISQDEAASRIRYMLEDSVRLRVNCDVPVGSYLSGGVDSSAVATIMSKFHTKPIQTFCLGYRENNSEQLQGKEADILAARKISRLISSDHHELFISAKDFSDTLVNILRAFDEPFSGTISTFFLSELISKHVKVTLSGDGADELFGSYLAHRIAMPMDIYLKDKEIFDLPYANRACLAPFHKDKDFIRLKNISHKQQSKWRDKIDVFSLDERQKLLNEDFFGKIQEYLLPINILEDKLTAQDPLNLVLEVDQADLLPNQILPFVDRLSMAHSVEVRCPFLDINLVEFVNHLPGTFKINNCINKYILKKAVCDLLPEDIINRPKEGFVQPIYSWMHSQLKNWIHDILYSLPMELFHLNYLNSIIDKWKNYEQDTNAKIYNLVCFSIWWNEVKQ